MVHPLEIREQEAWARNQSMSFFARLCGHTWMILRHKYWVFRFACIAGIPWQGFMHDWSKFSRMEFVESVRYYNGICSPIWLCKRMNHGMSWAWIHHHGRNLHHYEAWQDDFDHGAHPVDMPYRYAVEMLCDFLAAGKAVPDRQSVLAVIFYIFDKIQLFIFGCGGILSYFHRHFNNSVVVNIHTNRRGISCIHSALAYDKSRTAAGFVLFFYDKRGDCIAQGAFSLKHKNLCKIYVVINL